MSFKSIPSQMRSSGFLPALTVIAIAVILLLGRAFLPGNVLFSNDGPLGRQMSSCHQLPSGFNGSWEDLNTLGYREPGALPSITSALRLVLGPLGFSKFYASIGLLIMGASAWFFFRTIGLVKPACLVASLAVTLNVAFFSTACWGEAGRPICFGMCFLAMAAVTGMTSSIPQIIMRAALAGLAIGMGMAEAADVGVLFAVLPALYVAYQIWQSEIAWKVNLGFATLRLALMVSFAAFLAAQAISVQLETQIEGIAGMSQDQQTREERWDWVTQWSLPKAEMLQLLSPGLFGYRTDSPMGSQYWGAIGRDAKWQRYLAEGSVGEKPRGLIRQTGSGIYPGILVLMVAIWAACQSFLSQNSIFGGRERKWLWFWLVIVMGSLLLALGRHAPFYHLVYKLPFLSTVRNPVKFLYIFNFGALIMFAYGLDGLWRKYMQPATSAAFRPAVASKSGAKSASPPMSFEKIWGFACLGVLAVSLLAWYIYYRQEPALEAFLSTISLPEAQVHLIADYSVKQPGRFVIFFVGSAILIWLIFSGVFSRRSAVGGMVCAAVLLSVDLGLANYPWIQVQDYAHKYATNPVLDFLKDKPYEHRVAILPLRWPQKFAPLGELHRLEWSQHEFQYFNIQSLNIIQLPRAPTDLKTFRAEFESSGSATNMSRIIRGWQLTNTRYILGPAEVLAYFQQKFDPVLQRFKIAVRFNLKQKPESFEGSPFDHITAELAPEGDYALIEFTGALPRAKLYQNWEVNTNFDAVLKRLAEPEFDPVNSVIVNENLPQGAARGTAGSNSGTVEFASYAPKDIVLKANAPADSILLVDDRIDRGWHAWVDGQPAPIIRCNYLMRGVYLKPGEHTVEYRFIEPYKWLLVSLSAILVGFVLLGIVIGTGGRAVPPPPPAKPPTPPAAKGAKAR